MVQSNYKRAVVITDPDGGERTFPSQSEAARTIGIGQSEISKMCRGEMRSRRGYKARFFEMPTNVLPMRPSQDSEAG